MNLESVIKSVPKELPALIVSPFDSIARLYAKVVLSDINISLNESA